MDHDGFVMWNSDQTQIQYLWSCQTNPYTHHGHEGPKGLHFQAVHPEVQSMEQVAAMKAAIEGGLGALGADDQLMIS